MIAALTTPFRDKHPGVTFSILSRTSIEVLSLLDNFDIDAGITYLDNEPLGRVTARAALFRALPADHRRRQAATRDRETVTWAEVGSCRSAC